MLFGNVYSDPGTFEDKVGTKLNKIAAQGGSDEPETLENQEEEETPAKPLIKVVHLGSRKRPE